ncbi:hypothetical protein CEXT_43071 [Caerostris extrusa]|uniref:Uncharacterized protein n=1 Tax=Caerostris extrusa TaxID=172846 RepID=A0AAV4WHI9_CAEEX|nr:hypothetical protein CEXT_43071 [Caerostris extrusa]
MPFPLSGDVVAINDFELAFGRYDIFGHNSCCNYIDGKNFGIDARTIVCGQKSTLMLYELCRNKTECRYEAYGSNFSDSDID